MIFNIKFHQVGDGILDLLNSRIAKFNYFSTFLTDQVVMLSALISFFKLGNVLTKLMFDHQVALQKQFYGVV